MSYQVGDTYTSTVEIHDEDDNLADPATLVLRVRQPDGTVTTTTHPDSDIEHEGTGEFYADVLFDTAGMWVVEWTSTGPQQREGIQIAVSAAPTAGITFATLDELAKRLGKLNAAALSAEQRAQGQMLLELVTGLIVDDLGRDDAWAAALHPIPRIVRAVVLESVARVMQNPGGARSESETLGAYSHSTSYTDNTHGLSLFDTEIALVRKALNRGSSASARVESFVTEMAGVTAVDLLDPTYGND